MKVTIEELQEYLFDHYSSGGIDQSLFMKLVEEIGEVAEVLNKKAGRKSTGREDLQAQLGNELADVIHYAVAIAALNGIDMNDVIINKDKEASIKYNHKTNLEQFILIKEMITRAGRFQNTKHDEFKNGQDEINGKTYDSLTVYWKGFIMDERKEPGTYCFRLRFLTYI